MDMTVKTIRRGVFETNSSSSHSISLGYSNEGWETIEPNSDGVIVLRGEEFGWGVYTICDAESKANYAVLDALLNEDNELVERVVKVIEEYTGYPVELSLHDLIDGYNSYIDHQSVGTFADECFSEDEIKQFIFNRSSELELDNDNH